MSQPHHVTVEASLGGVHGNVVVNAVRGREEVSRAFRYQIDLTADEMMIEETRGSSAAIVLRDHLGQERYVSGVVDRIEVLASHEERNRFRLHLVPLAWRLAYQHGYRIFQDQTVPDIVKQVFREAGMDETYLALRLGGSYPARPLCVQYHETEWSFVCRLLEEEGIWFTFVHSPEGHRMVVCDISSNAEAAAPETLEYRHDVLLHGDAVRAWGFQGRARLCVKKAGVDGYDFQRPSSDLFGEDDGADGVGVWIQHSRPWADPGATARRAKARLGEVRASRSGMRLATNALPIQAGQKFELVGHPAGGSCFVKSLALQVRLEEVTEDGPLTDRGPPEARLDLELFPGDQQFRPERLTRRPVIAGLQTARVVGPPGEEIHCDPYGRVKLLFHWDSEHELNDKASCWIRVAQPHTNGSVMVPRVGWEVLVEFLDGDPDHPICQGRVFNVFYPPPYELPGSKNVTAHRSNSSPGAAGVNELRFDDSDGAQEVFVGAHRDLNITAANDHRYEVKQADTRVVGGKRTVLVGSRGAGIETITVSGSFSARVEGEQKIDLGTRSVKVSHGAVEEVKGNLISSIQGDDTFKVGDPIAAIAKAAAVHAVKAVGDRFQKAALAKVGLEKPLSALQSNLDRAARLCGTLAQGNLGPLNEQLSATAKTLADVKSISEQTLGGALAVELSDAVEAAVDSRLSAAPNIQPVAAPQAQAAPPKGDGSWNFTVHGNATEVVKGEAVLIGANRMAQNVGGKSSETAEVGRVLVVANGGAKESTRGNSVQMVGGLCLTQTKKGIDVQAGMVIGTSAVDSQKIEVKKSYEIAGQEEALMASSKIDLKAKEQIVLSCGLAEVVIGSDGLQVKGLNVKIEGTSKLELSQPAILPSPV